MKALFGVQGILIMMGLLVLFGGAFFDLATTGARCALGISGTANYTCDEFASTIGSTLILPDRNVKVGTQAILALRSLDQETIDKMGVIYHSDESSYRMQIYLGLAGIAIIFFFLTWIFIKLSPASSIDAGSMGVSIIAALLVMSMMHIAYTGFVEGHVELPFTGVVTLLQHQEVLWDVVDDTSLLPGTLTSKDILENPPPT